MLSFVHHVIAWAWIGVPATALVFTLVVFFHELGHFLVARACGVAVETFSIGFGGEIVGWTDTRGTRWKLSWLPLGGYVKFKGDDGPTSMPDREKIARMSADERKSAFPLKPLYQRALVAAAGPAANFLLAIVVYSVLFATIGAGSPSTTVGEVLANTPAAAAGIRAGDRILSINGQKVVFFADIHDALANLKDKPVSIVFNRNGNIRQLTLNQREIHGKDLFGANANYVGIGIGPDTEDTQTFVFVRLPVSLAPVAAVSQVWGITDLTLTYLERIVTRQADASQLSGPVGIAKAAKTAASHGLYDLISLIAFLSVSIGLINLFPIPLLDGGHLLYYGCEAVLGRPLDERTQDVGFRLGLALVLGLLIFTTWNNLVR
jgi:regulator of sigma E protease